MRPDEQNGLNRLKITPLSTVQPERVEWLWPGWLPQGKLGVLDGDPAVGKSTLSLNIAAIITTGSSWPTGETYRHPADVLLLSAEDGLADTVRPRLDAAGADPARVHAIEGQVILDDNGEKFIKPLTLADVNNIEDAMTRTGARLLIVDVLMAFLPSGTDSHRDQDIRRVLSALGYAAERNNCTVLMLRHLNKAKGGDPLYRGGGSIGIIGACRFGLLAAPDPTDPERRVLASTKSNLAQAPESLSYRLVSAEEHGVARIEWLGTSEHDARGLLADNHDGDDEPGGSPAKSFIIDYLLDQGGESPAGDVIKAGRANGFNEGELKDGRRRSRSPRIVSRKGGMSSGWVWALDYEGGTSPEGGSKSPEGGEGGVSTNVPPSPPSTDTVPPSEPATRTVATTATPPPSAHSPGLELVEVLPTAATLPIETVPTDRRPGCICTRNPAPCQYCQMTASKHVKAHA